MTAADFEQEVERHFWHNAIVNWLDGTFFWFGMSFIATSTILPLYVSHFTDNKMVIGLLSALVNTGWLVPQLFTANWVQRLPRKKAGVVNVGLFSERLPLLLLAPSALLAIRFPTLALLAFFVVFAWHVLGAGAVAVSWQDMLAKVIPVNRRGRFLGITNFSGMGTGVLGAAVAAWLLGRYAFPSGYVACFAVAAVFIFFSWVALSLTREPVQVSQLPVISQREYWRRLPAVLRADLNFRRYLLSRAVITIGGMAVGFLAVYAAQRWRLPDSQAGGFTASMLIGQAVCSLLFGALADRKGYKLILELSTLLGALAVGLASVAPAPGWFHAVFALSGAAFAGFYLSSTMIALEFSAASVRPTYIGLNNTVVGVVSGLAPVLGGGLAQVLGYQTLFVVACAAGLLGWTLMHWLVHEPRHTSNLVKDDEGVIDG